jgi:hypothetical protein
MHQIESLEVLFDYMMSNALLISTPPSSRIFSSMLIRSPKIHFYNWVIVITN